MMRRILLLTVLWIGLSIPFGLFPAQSQDKLTRGIRVVKVITKKGKSVDLYRGSHALLIGISDYTNGWPDLESIPGELDRLEKALKKKGFSVDRLRNPNSRQLKKGFEEFIEKYGYEEENRLLFFFSGHGYTRTTAQGRRKGYLVPTDAPNPNIDLKNFNRKALTMSRILTMAREIEAKHALFLFDSCFSGTIFKTRALPVPRYITEKSTLPVRQFITAGSAGEEVPAESIFLPTFIRAIEGDGDINKDGYVTGTELGQYLNQKVLSYDKGQTPQYGKIQDPALDQGDFVFLSPLATPTPPPIVRTEPKPPPRQSINAEETLWGIIEKSTELLDFQDYLKEFPLGRFAAAARIKIRRLKRQQQKTPPVRPTPPLPRVEVPPPRAAIRRDTKPVTWTDAVMGMRFGKVPGGSFRMGCGPWAKNCDADEKPVRTVRLSTFWMAQTEVTQGQYRKIMGVNPSSKKNGDNFPVESVSWYDVQTFVQRLNARSSKQFRLPTEAEWEYACRGGGGTVSFGTMTGKLDPGLANYSASKRYQGISPVAIYPPNSLGLYDMSGNVWEWVSDKYALYRKVGTNNPNHQSSGAKRVKRGGAWSSAPRYVRCENRVSFPPDSKNSFRGFRLAITNPVAAKRTWNDPLSGITLVKVSGGSFQMGCGSWTRKCDPDEKPVRSVIVSDFWIGRTEVTQAQYQKIMGANPSERKHGGNYPVEMISWHDAQSFIQRLNLRSGERFRLPTEAEWEYACRGGGRKVSFGTRTGKLNAGLANYSESKRYRDISPVASYPPNRLGLYDMSGNVWEWVSDKFARYGQVGTNNPDHQSSGNNRVKRGGGWSDASRFVRCENRINYPPNSKASFRGFRLAMTSPYGLRSR